MKRKEKGAALGLVVCFVAMIGIVGMITFKQNGQESKVEEKNITQTTKEKKSEPTETVNTDEIQSQLEEKKEIIDAPKVETLKFTATDTLAWPVEGNVILNYSMNRTVYFSTLDQYRYNPAIMIGSDVGAEVKSAAIGEVTNIETSAQTGITITVSVGSGYEVVYGQLKDICVEKGDRITKGQVIGYLSEPTKYYNVEGPNLYFQMLHRYL